MSTPEVGSAFVRLQLDPADFEQKIVKTAEDGAAKAQAAVDRQVEQQAQAITDLQSRAETARLRAAAATARGDQAVAEAQTLAGGLLDLQANIAQAQFAAESSLRSAATAMGTEREQFLAAAEAYQAAAKIGQDTLRRSQEAGKLVNPRVPGGGGLLSQLEEFGRASGSRSGLDLLLRQGARLGTIGLVATASFQALNELQRALRVTGDEAYTAEGKLRNAGAALLSGNIIGSVRALTAEKPVQIVGDLADKLAEAKAKSDPFVVNSEKLEMLYKRAPEELGNYLTALVAFNKISVSTATELAKIVEQNILLEKTAKTAAMAVGDVERAIQKAGSEAGAFGERGNEFGRGAAAIAAEQAKSIATGGVTVQGTGGQSVANEIRSSIASRLADERARTAAELESAKIIQAQKRATFENVRHTGEAAAAWKDYVLATTEVVKATRAAKEATQAAANAAQDAANSIRDAQAGRIRDEGARLQAELANAKIVESQKKAAVAAAKTAQESQAANVAYQQAVTARIQLENQIADRNDAMALSAANEKRSTEEARLANAEAKAALTARTSDDIAAIKATRDYYLKLASSLKGSEAEAARAQAISASARLAAVKSGDGTALREQQLQNQVQAAQLTGRLADDRKAAQDLVRFWKSQVQDAEGLAKARAEGNLLDSKARLAAVNQSIISNRQQVLQNRAQAAQLTKSLDDDKAAADALVAFWQKQVKAAQGAEKERLRANLIAARIARQQLDQQAESGGGPSTLDILGISRSIIRDFAGNLLAPGTGAAGSRGLFELPGITATVAPSGPEEEQVDELRRIRQLLEQKNGPLGATVIVTQSFRDTDPSGFAQARYARFAMEEAFNG